MRPGALLVHVCRSNVSISSTFIYYFHHFSYRADFFFNARIWENSLLWGFSNLHFLLSRIKEVHNVFIVYFKILTSNVELHIDGIFIELWKITI